MDIRLALMTGVDIPIPDCKLVLHQPSMKEIGAIGEYDYLSGLQYLCINKYMIEDKTNLDNVTNFQIFMTIMTDKQAGEKKLSIMNALFLLFPNYKVSFTPRSLLFNSNNENSIIDENNFSSFQEVLRQVGCLNGKDSDSFNPANEAAAEIARKLKRGRQRVAAQKQSAEGNSSVFSQYLSILTIGLHISLLELSNMTMYQLYDLIERYSLYINWDLDIRSRLAGGKPDNQPDNWMKVIH